MAWFRRKGDDMSVAALQARADAASPTPAGTSTPAGARADPQFRLTVEDVFVITGRGTVVTGKVESGTVATGQTVRLLHGDTVGRPVKVTGIEAFRAMLTTASAGANVGLLLGGVDRADVAAGDVLTG